MIQTGKAVLETDDFGKKYWKCSDDSSKDAYKREIGECIEFSPEAFEEGTEIKIFENAE